MLLGLKAHLIKCIIIKIGCHQINESQKQVSAAKVMAKAGRYNDRLFALHNYFIKCFVCAALRPKLSWAASRRHFWGTFSLFHFGNSSI